MERVGSKRQKSPGKQTLSKQALKMVSYQVPQSFDESWYARATPLQRSKAMQLGQDLIEHWKQVKAVQDSQSKTQSWEREMMQRIAERESEWQKQMIVKEQTLVSSMETIRSRDRELWEQERGALQQEIERQQANVRSFESNQRILAAHAKELEERLSLQRKSQEEERMVLWSRSNESSERLVRERDERIAKLVSDMDEMRTKFLLDLSASDARQRAEMDAVHRDKDAAVNTLQQEIKHLRETLRQEYNLVYSGMMREKEERMAVMQAEMERMRDKYIQDVRQADERIRDAVVAATREKDVAIQAAQAQLIALTREKDAQIESYRNQTETMTRRMESQMQNVVTEINVLQQRYVTRQANSTRKGSDFEDEFKDHLHQVFGVCQSFRLFPVKNDRGGGLGDFIMQMDDFKIMWETKNYTKKVPQEEVNKFKRDLMNQPDISIGVFVSNQTEIVGQEKSNIYNIEIENNKMMIFVANYSSYGQQVLQWIIPVCRVWNELRVKGEFDPVSKQQVIQYVQSIIYQSEQQRRLLQRHKQSMTSLMEWVESVIQGYKEKMDQLVLCLRQEKPVSNIMSPFETSDSMTLQPNISIDIHTDNSIGIHTDTAINPSKSQSPDHLVYDESTDMFPFASTVKSDKQRQVMEWLKRIIVRDTDSFLSVNSLASECARVMSLSQQSAHRYVKLCIDESRLSRSGGLIGLHGFKIDDA